MISGQDPNTRPELVLGAIRYFLELRCSWDPLGCAQDRLSPHGTIEALLGSFSAPKTGPTSLGKEATRSVQ